ncbi:MAG: hypothetical protein R3E82_22485 [Pseudomonadales bacterium]|nr:hypothetical protein [Pseudomonadales bacterium]
MSFFCASVKWLASLPWYDLPPARQHLDSFWSHLRQALVERGIAGLPQSLDRTRAPSDLWRLSELLLSQCCGLDLFAEHGRDLKPFATPVFADLDCPPGTYFSHIVQRSNFRGKPERAAVNAPSSRSGCDALLEWCETHDLPDVDLMISGSHAHSLTLLRRGVVDLAAIDAHSYPLLDTRGVRIIGSSAPSAAPPFVMHTDCTAPVELLRTALGETIRHAGMGIGIGGLLPADRTTYAAQQATAGSRNTSARWCMAQGGEVRFLEQSPLKLEVIR